jgi:hypothetical protein
MRPLVLDSRDDHIERPQAFGPQPADGFLLRLPPQRISGLQHSRTFARKGYSLSRSGTVLNGRKPPSPPHPLQIAASGRLVHYDQPTKLRRGQGTPTGKHGKDAELGNFELQWRKRLVIDRANHPTESAYTIAHTAKTGLRTEVTLQVVMDRPFHPPVVYTTLTFMRLESGTLGRPAEQGRDANQSE